VQTALNAETNIATAAASIRRTLINAIIPYPWKRQGDMTVDVYGDPSALFLELKSEAAKAENWTITLVAEEGLEPPTRGL
jgi:hypothetical protein